MLAFVKFLGEKILKKERKKKVVYLEVFFLLFYKKTICDCIIEKCDQDYELKAVKKKKYKKQNKNKKTIIYNVNL